jgi:molybdenum cofactor cytidylyltransferase
MKFATVATGDALGSVLAHSVRLPGLVIVKGRRLDQNMIAQLREAGVEKLVVAMIEAGDVEEDRAAKRVAANLAGDGVVASEARTGRVNLCATRRGLVLVEPQLIHALNRINEAITIATAPLHDVVEPGEIIATIKVNPYAVAEKIVAAWEATATPCLRVAPFRLRRASLIQTVLPGLKPSVLEKTVRATRTRLEALDGALVAELRIPHQEEALAREIGKRLLSGDDLILVCGACSIADRRDVIPAAIEAAGGRVEHFGMPVDPGNLLLLGAVGAVPVIGMPGCARALQTNGFDQVLRRVAASLPVGSTEIMAMGVGGLLRETPWRPARQAATATAAPPRIAAIVLAAGQSRRMGENKLLLPLEGKPVLRHVVDAIRASRLASITMVLGHQADQMRAMFAGPDVNFVFNENYREGLSTSLKAGVAALPGDVDGAMVFLGDMPDVDADLVDRMIAAFDPLEMRAIVVPIRKGRRGHPVLWGRGFFPALLSKLDGDAGARHLIGQYAEWTAEVEVGHDGIFMDIDTPEAFSARTHDHSLG